MALAPSLIPGFQYKIINGDLEDEIVTIVDNTVLPPKHPHQRKVTIRFSDGSTGYVLPRQLADRPCGVVPESVNVEAAPAVQSMVTPTVVPAVDVPALDVATAVAIVTDEITDPMDPRLDHLRPSRAKVRRYIKREMANGMTDVQMFLHYTSDEFRARNDGRPVNLAFKGDTQSGKTFFVEALAVAWADMLGLSKPMPIFTLSGSSGVTDFDLFGQTTSYTDPATGKESLIFLPGIAALAAQVGGILYLDEINAMGERVTSSLHPLLDHRHQFINRNKPVFRNGQFMPEVVTASLDLWIIATYNEGYRGMGKMNEALHQRFDHVLWDYDEAVESKLIKSPTVRLIGQAFRMARKQNKLRTPFGTAAMERLHRNVQTFGVEMGIEIMLGMFEGNERDIASEIVDGRSFIIMLKDEEEARQRGDS